MAKHFIVKELNNLRVPWYGRPPLDVWLKLKQFVYQRDEGLCQYCKELTRYEDTHCHHVLELSEGGTNHPSNLKTVCKPCHKERHPFMKNASDRLKEMR